MTGLAIPPHDAEALAKAITELAADRALAVRMGAAAHQMAISNFQAEQNAAKLLKIYKRMTGHPAP